MNFKISPPVFCLNVCSFCRFFVSPLKITKMKLLIAAAVLAVASCSPQNVFTFTQYNPAGTMPFEQYWSNFKNYTQYVYKRQFNFCLERNNRKFLAGNITSICSVDILVMSCLRSFNLLVIISIISDLQTRTMQVQMKKK